MNIADKRKKEASQSRSGFDKMTIPYCKDVDHASDLFHHGSK